MAERPLGRLGLKGAIFGSFAFALVLIFGVLYAYVPQQIRASMLDRLEARGRLVANEIRGRAAPGAGPAASAAISALNGLAAEDPEIHVSGITDAEGKVLARGPHTDPAVLQTAATAHQASGFKPRTDLWDGDILVSEELLDADGHTSGYVILVMDAAQIPDVVKTLRRAIFFTFLGGSVVFLLLLYLVSRAFILRPLNAMMEVASKLSDADLTVRVEVMSQDELGALSQTLNRIGETLRETVGRVRGVAEGVAQVIEQISRAGNTVSSGAGTTLSRVEETSSSMVQMLTSLRGIAQNVEVLYHAAEEGSSSIMQMAATNDEVAENVQAMASSVEETTSAIEEMSRTIKEVACAIEALLATTEETSSSMNEMDVSIGQVETNANETARLSEQVSQDAAVGAVALQKTLAGIDKIKESARTASSVIESLGKQISDVGTILGVIDDVAEQTNLLALNAAIIAAQAGEHGKGFAVVAEEIKDLAERTGASTKEIADLVRRIQEESRNAVSAMTHGLQNVEEGVELGRAASGALTKILDSANKSTTMVKAIARATVEQARGSRQVTSSIQRIAESVQQISRATNDQALGSEQIISSAEKMKAITQHVQRSSQEQAHGSKQITKSIESINEMVTHLNRAQKEQTQGSDQVLKAVEAIKSVAEHQTRSVRQLEEAITSLQRQAEVLRAEVRRFRL